MIHCRYTYKVTWGVEKCDGRIIVWWECLTKNGDRLTETLGTAGVASAKEKNNKNRSV